MPDRITRADLERLVRVINVRVNGDACDPLYHHSADHRTTARVGAFYLDGAYGGLALYRITSEAGGVDDVFDVGHMTKRELHSMLRAFYTGLEVADSD